MIWIGCKSICYVLILIVLCSPKASRAKQTCCSGLGVVWFRCWCLDISYEPPTEVYPIGYVEPIMFVDWFSDSLGAPQCTQTFSLVPCTLWLSHSAQMYPPQPPHNHIQFMGVETPPSPYPRLLENC